MEVDIMDYDQKAVGRAIKMLRKKSGKSQEVISGFAGIARSHLSMIETGSKQANLETLWKLADAFEITPSKLVSKIEEESIKDTYKVKGAKSKR